MKKSEIFHLAVSGALMLSIGGLTGYSLGYFQAKTASFPAIKTVDDINEGITTIQFLESQGGKITARVDGNPARIAYSPENIFDIEPGQEFTIPLYQVNLGSFYTVQNLPEDAIFVASSQGKYFYHVFDPQAFKITPKNRLYFTKESQALASGYLPKN